MLKNSLISLVEESTIHGLPRISKTDSWLIKMVWLGAFLASSSCCIYLNINSIMNFLQYDTITRIETIRQSPADFPVITLCNYNQYPFNDTHSLIDNISSMFNFNIRNVERDFFIRNQIIAQNDSF